ncbi:hypothetical protein DLAC_03326 [Tieghemostelium lacteum]|uniref:RBR-type E3 ubiquitin transferase n=1 Tax=Tieghemostelium lacteum TaxID=361077 RepID=A0A152A1P6_TIELA|nr:hypothetical protein DLAC_03326 [Tieghemostelium lacteum]|eukprot:KYR00172.1 hypothetical protein DLAC_03326 [Tieghemostelium lacteum]
MESNISTIKSLLPDLSDKDIKDALESFNNNIEETINYLMSQPVVVEDENDRLFKEFMKSEQEKLEKGHNERSYLCSICYDDLPIQDFYIMDECYHRFCIDCIQQHYLSQIRSGYSDIKCPQNLCKYKVKYQEVQHILKGKDFDLYDQLLFNHSMAKDKNVRYCPVPNCSSIVISQPDGSCQCPVPECGYEFCGFCRNASHSGMTCAQFEELQEELRTYTVTNTFYKKTKRPNHMDPSSYLFRPSFSGKSWKKDGFDMVSGATKVWILKNTQQCPHCKTIVEKNMGCNSMACHCGHLFCFGCGKSREQHNNYTYPCSTKLKTDAHITN